MPQWGSPIAGKGSAHDFGSDPVLEACFERSEMVDVPDRDRPGEQREARIHRFVRDGELVDVWGSKDLDDKLRVVSSGRLVRIVFLGMKELDGGRSMKMFTVQVDESGEGSSSMGKTFDSTGDDIPF